MELRTYRTQYSQCYMYHRPTNGDGHPTSSLPMTCDVHHCITVDVAFRALATDNLTTGSNMGTLAAKPFSCTGRRRRKLPVLQHHVLPFSLQFRRVPVFRNSKRLQQLPSTRCEAAVVRDILRVPYRQSILFLATFVCACLCNKKVWLQAYPCWTLWSNCL